MLPMAYGKILNFLESIIFQALKLLKSNSKSIILIVSLIFLCEFGKCSC